MENQLTILSESLDRKLQVLKDIQKYNEQQEQSFLSETIKLEDFDEAIEEKGRLIERLNKLDEGFEAVYSRLAEELKGNREKYKAQIAELQNKIRQVTELGTSIQAQEKRNKALVEQYFSKSRENIRQERKNSKAAYNYYKNMSGNSVSSSQFMDSRQ